MGEEIKNEEFLELDCDFLVPSALALGQQWRPI